MELEGHSSESFTLNDVNFTYSRNVGPYGYHLAEDCDGLDDEKCDRSYFLSLESSRQYVSLVDSIE
jgi:hypothetical protein